jgi:hypothetical protein
MYTSFYELLLIKLREAQDTYNKRILSGKLIPEEYKELCGIVEGLKQAEKSVKNCYKSLYENTFKENA